MKFVDTHTHLDTLTWTDMENMTMAGVQTVISPIHLDAGKPVSCNTIRDMWDFLFDVQFWRARENFITPYAMIGITMVSTPKDDPAELYAILPEYLCRREVVALGEIGFEPNSDTCKDMEFQETLVRRQVEIAVDAGTCVDFHLPGSADLKVLYTDKLLAICRDCGLPMNKVVMDHSSEANIAQVLEAGAHAAISVQPWRNMTPEKAADIVVAHGITRVMFDSDCSCLASDPLALPKTALALKRKGVSDEDIEQVMFHNANAFFGLTQ